MWIDRLLSDELEHSVNTRPAVLVTGARQAGKSSLLQRSFPGHRYVTLDRSIEAAQAQENPTAFLDRHGTPLIIDEIQYAPDLFREIKIRIDTARDLPGQFLLTGSQTFPLMAGIRESLAGRVRLLQLYTLSAAELRGEGSFQQTQVDEIIWRGGYPELWKRIGLDVSDFYEDYVGTYLERDLRHIVAVREVHQFRIFLGLLASRIGNLLNYTDISRSVGVSANTVKDWVGALQASGLVFLLPPWFPNVSKRLTKTPKVYFADTGLVVHLNRLGLGEEVMNAPMWGAVWENFVITELIKTARLVPGRTLFFYRDRNGVEADAVIDDRNLAPEPIVLEVKSSPAASRHVDAVRRVAKELSGAATPRIVVAAPIGENTPIHLSDHVVFDPRRVDFSLVSSAM